MKKIAVHYGATTEPMCFPGYKMKREWLASWLYEEVTCLHCWRMLP